jgi:hypothetical protein
MTGKEKIAVTIRNPYDVLVSWFVLNKPGLFKNFDEFIKGYNHTFMLVGGKMFWLEAPGNDFQYIRYEYLQEDWDTFLKSAGMEPVALPHENRTPGKKPYREYYGPDTIKLVEEKFGEEIAKFGYTF